MAKSLSVQEARKRLKEQAESFTSSGPLYSLDEAKQQLRDLDTSLDLPPVVPYIDKAQWGKVLSVSLAWSTSEAGLKELGSLLRRAMLLR